jgi:two-component system sensor histidine kinase RcsD
MAVRAQHEEAEEKLLDDVVAMIDITSSEIRNIVVRQLENWGASCISPDERLLSQEYDLFLTDNPSNLTSSGLLLSDDEVGVRKIGPGQLRVNFNMSNAMQEAILQLIEEQLAQEDVMESPLGAMKMPNSMPAVIMRCLSTQYRMMLRGCILNRRQAISLHWLRQHTA